MPRAAVHVAPGRGTEVSVDPGSELSTSSIAEFCERTASTSGEVLANTVSVQSTSPSHSEPVLQSVIESERAASVSSVLAESPQVEPHIAPCSESATSLNAEQSTDSLHNAEHLLVAPDHVASEFCSEIAQLERSRAPLHDLSTTVPQQRQEGMIALDTDFLCRGSVQSVNGLRAEHVDRIMIDTGAQTSVISQATVQRLQSAGAISASDVLTLKTKRYVQSWDKRSPPRPVDTAVTLAVTAAGPNGSSATVNLPFLILPHLSKDAIIGRDFLNAQQYTMSSTESGSVLQFGTESEESKRERISRVASSVELLESAGGTDWCLAVVTAVRLSAGQDAHVLVRVQHSTTGGVVDAQGADLLVDIEHASLCPGMLVVGSGAMTVVLRSLRDCSLAEGEIIGPASLLTSADREAYASDTSGVSTDSTHSDSANVPTDSTHSSGVDRSDGGELADLQQMLTGSAPVDDAKTVTLGTYVSDSDEINQILADLHSKLPQHMLKLQVDLSGWSEQQISRLGELLLKHQTVFSKDKWDIGHCEALPFDIALKPDAKPCSDRPYRYSPPMTKLVKVEIDRLLAAGIIRPSMSEWASPVVAVLKKDGTARITVNYRKLNSMTVVPQMPLPHIADILDSLGGSTVFTTMDITSGYFTSAIKAEAIPLTAMVTAFGLYEWLRCPQGAAGAPGHFTRLMAVILAGLERVQPFIDDVIVNSQTVDQHLDDLDKLFTRLSDHNVKLAPGKVYIGCRSVKFLGHVVNVKGILPDPSKVAALVNMPLPATLAALRSWLGLANYYRRFIKGMARIIAPLTALLQKDAPFELGLMQRAAIREVNLALARHTLMVYPDYSAAASGERPFILSTDASKEGFGVVLSQYDSDGTEQPIAFASRATLRNERNWGITDLEAGAVVYGVKKFRHMLWGTPFQILTDHRALVYLESCKDKTARLARWYEFLSAFQYTITYKQGAKHSNADGVSRNPLPATDTDVTAEHEDTVLESYALELVHRSPTDRQSQLSAVELIAGAELLDLSIRINTAFSDYATSGVEAGTLVCPHSYVTLAVTDVLTERGLGMPAFSSDDTLGTLSASQWQEAQSSDPQLSLITQYLKNKQLPSEAPQAAAIVKLSTGCYLQRHGDATLLVRADWRPKHAAIGLPGVQLAVPKCLRDQVLQCLHGTAWAGHQGVRRTMAAVRKHVWWPTWEADTAYWVQHCWPCQARKRGGRVSRWPQVLRDMPQSAFDSVAFDIFGPLPKSAAGHTHVLVMQDLYTRWVDIYALLPAQNTADGIATILVDEYCTRHGVPRTLLSDRGTQFMAALSVSVYKHMGVRKLFTTAYHPQCNGTVERFMQSLATMLSMVVDGSHSDWHLWLNHVAFAYNASEHAATGVSPFLMATGREPRIALHQILGHISDADAGESLHISNLVSNLLTRQRDAQSVANRRFALRQATLLRENERLAAALGLRASFSAGERVWLYRAPVSHRVGTDADAQADLQTDKQDRKASTMLSRKFLNYWNGPYEVLCVGPGSIGSGDSAAKVGKNCLLIMRDGRPTRVSVHQCKKCRDPTSSDRPDTLPTGFAQYLLATSQPSAVPSSVDDNEATWEPDRHGVEAVTDHRLVAQARGRARTLQYKVRWEGEAMADSWEDAHYLDSCPQALAEYWHQVSVSHERTNTPVLGGNTAVVRGRMKQARAMRSLRSEPVRTAQTGRAFYEIPPGNTILRQYPGSAFRSKLCEGLRVLIVWPNNEGDADEHSQWYDGKIISFANPSTAKSKQIKRRKLPFRVAFETGGTEHVELSADKYSTELDAAYWSWCIYGTAAELTRFDNSSEHPTV